MLLQTQNKESGHLHDFEEHSVLLDVLKSVTDVRRKLAGIERYTKRNMRDTDNCLG